MYTYLNFMKNYLLDASMQIYFLSEQFRRETGGNEMNGLFFYL